MDDGSMFKAAIIVVIVCIVAYIGYSYYDNSAREIIMDCSPTKSLYSPGRVNKEYCIKRDALCSDTDGGTYSCKKTVKCYEDEQQAIEACEEGRY